MYSMYVFTPILSVALSLMRFCSVCAFGYTYVCMCICLFVCLFCMCMYVCMYIYTHASK